MPVHRINTPAGRAFRPAGRLALLLLCTMLSGCAGGGMPGVAMFGGARAADPAASAAGSGEIARAGDDAEDRGETRSALIDELVSRRSVLPASGPYAQVAEAVLTANKGPAAAELRVARLKAEAKSKNWLPSIGPSVDLTSLGTLAASILVEQVIFDNGKRKAERAFAAADVEIAAVSLSEEMNKRVFEGLTFYITAQRAAEQAGLAERSVGRMAEYGRIMGLRVEGGISDLSEDRVISQKIAEMRSVAAADREAALTAQTELAAMVSQPLSGLKGLSTPAPSLAEVTPLAVIRARGEGRRLVAEAKIQRAGLLPGLKASATIAEGGIISGLRASAESAFGFGTGASLEALKATEEVAAQRSASAGDDSQRRIVALERKIAALASREAEEAAVLRQTSANLKMFTEQYKLGRRPLMELVGMYETFARLERDHAALKYDRALLQLQIAQMRGQLVDGERM
jgi:adhesin transport system outer membrane protein